MSNDIKIRVQGQDSQVNIVNNDKDKIKMYYEYTEDYFRKGYDYNLVVHKFSEVTNYTVNDSSIDLEIKGESILNTQIDCDGELRPVVNRDVKPETFKAWVKIEIYENGIFRMLAGIGDKPKPHDTVMLEGVKPLTPATFTIEDSGSEIIIKTAKCFGIIDIQEFNFTITDLNSKVVYQQSNNDKVLYFTHESFPFGFVENKQLNKKAAVCSSRMEHDENYYGFGEQYSPVNKKMQEVDVFITDPLSVGSPRTYLSLPFFWSTKGYGMYVNTHFRSKFFMGNRSNRSISCHIYNEDIIDIFYMYGENPKDILKSYTDITGKSPKLPRWSYGLWMSKCSYKTQQEVLDVARMCREHNIPCDVINIDTDWFEIPWACDWKFGKHNFPNPKEMMQQLDEMGFKICVWQKPYITIEHLPELTKFMVEKNWLPKNKYGEIARSNPVIDLSNPECYEWYKDRLKELMDLGVRVIKTDMGEGVPIEGEYYGYSGEEIHNIYPYLYSKVANEATIEHQGEGLLWGRSGYAGGQKYPIHWAGDPFTDYDGLRYTVRSGLSMGLSGFTYWSHDIGGFLGRPTNELYVRWAQAGFFCSHSRCHGAGNPREPWTFSEEVEDIFRKYDELRYSLISYIESTCVKYAELGLPIMEHLILTNPNDRNCINIDDQWMFGEAFLVSPILSEENNRDIYYPNGKWYDFWTNEVIEGNQYKNVSAPLETLPLYVKEGSIIPFNQVGECVDNDKQKDITFRVYYKEHGDSTFEYFYNDKVYEFKACFSNEEVIVEIPEIDCNISLELVYGNTIKEVSNITANKISISIAK